MERAYDLANHNMERFDLLGRAKLRRKLWRFISYCLTFYLPEFLLRRYVKHAEGFRSKIAFIVIILLTNAFFTYIFLVHASRNLVSIVATSLLGMIVYFRFIISLFNKRKIANAIPDHCGDIAFMLPCYTEGEDVLRSTIDSIAEAVRPIPRHVRKCLFVVCDGLVRGRSNSQTTPDIVRDVLGKPQHTDFGISYTSPWTGGNVCDVESGAYEGLSYMKITKHENRGKRDSQLLMMAFLRREENPLSACMQRHLEKLEMSSLKPFPFQYLFVTDSDTLVDKNAAKTLLEALTKSDKTIAVCGNVKVKNKHNSLLTMAQVYEYFFAQHFYRAAESALGQVTCLPGAFSLYKLYHILSNEALHPDLLCDDIYYSFGFHEANTLHRMNLTLGEDRYLTSLIWKFMPSRRVYFIPAAECKTGVPETARVLLSQRRRWDNSGLHNVFDMIFIPGNPIIRFLYCFQILSSLLVPTMAVVGVVVFVQMAESIMHFSFTTMQYVCYGTALLGLTGSAFVKGQPHVLVYLPIYLMCLPFFILFIPIYTAWTMDNVRWGKTQPTFNQPPTSAHGGKDDSAKLSSQRKIAEPVITKTSPGNITNDVNMVSQEINCDTAATPKALFLDDEVEISQKDNLGFSVSPVNLTENFMNEQKALLES